MSSPVARYRTGVTAVAALSLLALVGCTPVPGAGEQDATVAATTVELTVPEEGTSATLDRIREEGVLRAGVIVSAPFALQDPVSSDWYGPAPATVEALASALDVDVEWVLADWDTVIAGLQSQKYDIATTGLYATPERKEVVDFVNYAQSGACYAVRKDDDRVNSLEDLHNPELRAVLVSGSSYVTEFPAAYPEPSVASKPAPAGGGTFYSEVTTDRFDVVPIESTLARVVAEQQPDLKIIPDLETCLVSPDLPQDVGFAVRKDDAAFRELLQETADQLKEETAAAVVEYADPEYVSGE